MTEDPHAHSKLIAAAAREILGPMGLRRKGRSRTWIDDQGLWVGVVEFQHSSWAKGSYLNVGPMWLWHAPILYIDYGGRVLHGGWHDQFVKFVSAEQFAPEAQRLAARARSECERYRAMFAEPREIARVLLKAEPRTVRPCLNAGIALGLAGELEHARIVLSGYVEQASARRQASAEPGDDDDLYGVARVQSLIDLTHDRSSFQQRILADVAASRALLKLPPRDLQIAAS